MFTVYSLIFFACSLNFFRFHSGFRLMRIGPNTEKNVIVSSHKFSLFNLFECIGRCILSWSDLLSFAFVEIIPHCSSLKVGKVQR